MLNGLLLENYTSLLFLFWTACWAAPVSNFCFPASRGFSHDLEVGDSHTIFIFLLFA